MLFQEKRRKGVISMISFPRRHQEFKSPSSTRRFSAISLRLLLLLLALGGVLHLLVGLRVGSLLSSALVGHLLRGVSGGLGLSVGLLLGLLLLALFSRLGLSLSAALVLFGLAALVEALDDRGGGGAELLVLGDVLGLGGVLAVLVEPILEKSVSELSFVLWYHKMVNNSPRKPRTWP